MVLSILASASRHEFDEYLRLYGHISELLKLASPGGLCLESTGLLLMESALDDSIRFLTSGLGASFSKKEKCVDFGWAPSSRKKQDLSLK